MPSFSTVEQLIESKPLVVQPDDRIADVARQMTERGCGCAVVPLGEDTYGLVTDESLRARVISDGVPTTASVSEALATSVPIALVGDSAGEALLTMLEDDADYVVVLDTAHRLCGVVSARDFTLSPTTADVPLHQQIRRSGTIDELVERSLRSPDLLVELLSHGLASGKVIAVYSAIIDTVVRRAIELVFTGHADLPLDEFTWLSLGSNGRRESVLSSDVDSAVAFVGDAPPDLFDAYRAAFGEVHGALARAGLSSDSHGATAPRAVFSRTNAQWRDAAKRWLASPEQNQGAIMTSLLVDGRPVYGDHGLPAVTAVFADVRNHPGTLSLLLKESLSRRARVRTTRDMLMRRSTPFDIKDQALLPVVNIARWAALSVGSPVLSTVERLRAASGSEILPDSQARAAIEAFEVLQRLRLRYQLMQYQSGGRVSDKMPVGSMSAIDRSVIAQAVHEINALQRRMANVSAYLPPEQWTGPQE
ncbi:hypothetical protein VV02_18825 [Luteipulveratus mongoliensis]|uniref:Histidine kinase n=1 Tax=Luteipulveratus mongoliensis TaxID=571913 RepID=A0A0K1JQU5_9MICO|nr:hypothetical protein VV02_18825 [Luteipulveratus mongoliensis]